jgi:hypothetical protein
MRAVSYILKDKEIIKDDQKEYTQSNMIYKLKSPISCAVNSITKRQWSVEIEDAIGVSQGYME